MKFVIIIIYIIVLNIPLKAQWEKIKIPEGGRINCIAVNNSFVFTGTPGNGVFRRSLQEQKWVKIFNGFDNSLSERYILSMLVKDDYVFVGTASGMFYSKDSGNMWEKSSLPYFSKNYINSIVEVSKDTIIVQEGQSLYLYNYINNTTSKISSLGEIINSIFYNNNALYVSTVYGIYYTRNFGITWEPILKYDATFFDKISIIDNKVLAGNNKGLFIVGGNEAGLQQIFDKPVNDILVYNNKIIVTCTTGIYSSSDNGTTWSDLTNGLHLFYTANYNAITYKNDTLWLGSDGGVFNTELSRISWNKQISGLTNSFINIIYNNNGRLYVGTSKNGIFKFNNNEYLWEPVLADENIVNNICNICRFDDNDILFSSSSETGLYSVQNKISLYKYDLENSTIKSIFKKGANIICGSDKGIFILNRNNMYWEIKSHSLTNNKIESVFEDKDTLYAYSSYNLFHSFDQGNSWSNNYPDLQYQLNSQIKCVSKFNGAVFIGTVSGDIWKFDNLTKTWFRFENDFNGIDVLKRVILKFISHNNLFYAILLDGIYLYNQEKQKWEKIENNDSIFHNLAIVEFDSDNIYIFDPYMMIFYKRSFSSLVSVENISTQLTNFEIKPNYPNPFNPSTKIVFVLPEAGYVTINLYNSLGQLVKNICANEYHSMGRNEKEINMPYQSSGIYYYQIIYDGKVQTGKMNLIK